MDALDQSAALFLTHLPYWLIAGYIVVVARRTRRSIEAVIRDLGAIASRRDP